jgi:hypothetical protein
MRKAKESGMTFTSLSKYLQDWNNGGQNDIEPLNVQGTPPALT